LWRNSTQAVKWGLEQRVSLLNSQVVEFDARNPGLVQRTLTGRLTATLAQLYLLPPSFAEAGNYSEATARAETAYLAQSGSQLLRGPIWGAVLLILTVFGLLVSALKVRPPWEELSRGLFLLQVCTALMFVAILWAVQLPFQRYYFPLLPFSSLWSAFGLATLSSAIRNEAKNKGIIWGLPSGTRGNNK
jgi:hypothetical protein